MNTTGESVIDFPQSEQLPEQQLTEEQQAVRGRLQKELIELERSLPEMEFKDSWQRALELFVVRCNLEDLEKQQTISQPDGQDLGNSTVFREVLPEQSSDLDTVKLKDEYNIDYPDRYPRSVLERMLKGEMGGSDPWGLVVVAKYDHNGAFERTPALASLEKDLDSKCEIKIVEASNEEEAAELAKQLAGRFGKYLFGICIAHGWEKGFTFDGDEGEVRAKDTELEVSQASKEVETQEDYSEDENSNTSLKTFSQAFAQYSQPGASLVMASCSTGKGTNPVAKQIAQVSQRLVIAPDADSSTVAYNGVMEGPTVEFDPEYAGAATKKFSPDSEF